MPKLYVGTYKKYNEGSIAGKWLDLSDYANKDDFLKACAALHSDESYPEFMFQDCEDMPDELYRECSITNSVWDYMELRQKIGEDVVDAGLSSDIEPENIEEAYCGQACSELDYAREYIESTGMLDDVPESLSTYFDYPSFARDLFMDYTLTDGCVFSNNY